MKLANNIQPRQGHTTEFSKEDFAFIADLAKRKFGLNLSEAKLPLVHSRISKRMRELGVTEFEDYRQILKSGKNASEETKLLSVLTTNVTSFFRENHHFEHMHSILRERLKENSALNQPIRVWSAACSTGQEVYSIIMTLEDVLSKEQMNRVEIFASDIDPLVVERAKAGRYQASELSSVPAKYSRRFVRLEGSNEFQIDHHMISRVNFEIVNLVQPFPIGRSFDFVFCRNAAIYFDQETQASLWTKFANVVRSGGFLYIGHSERIHGEAASRLKSQGITVYTRL